MSHHWYWQTRGTIYGPLSTDELEDLVQRHRVLDDDSIRIDETDDWIPAVEIKALFTESLEGEADETAAQSAANALSHRARMRLSQDADEAQTGAAISSFFTKALGGIGGLSSALQALAARALTALTNRLTRVMVLSIVSAALLALLIFKLLSGVELRDTRAADAQLRLFETWEEFQAMKERRASLSEWEAFERDTIIWLKPMLTTLGETATANQASSIPWGRSGFDKGLGQQQLVSAGWILRDLIVEARRNSARPEGDASESRPRASRLMTFPTDPPEVLFTKRMTMAQAYLEGTAETLRPAHVQPPVSSDARWLAGLLGVGGCVLVCGAGWWWKWHH